MRTNHALLRTTSIAAVWRRPNVRYSAGALVLSLLVVFYVGWKNGPSGPRLRIPRCSLDLGCGSPGEVLTGSFFLSNVGSEILRFEIVASCGCSYLTPDAGEIAPGCSQQIAMSIRLPEIRGTSRTVDLAIETNDPDRPNAAYQASAESRSLLQVSPRIVDFGQIVEGESPSIKVQVKDADSKDFGSVDRMPAFSFTGSQILLRRDNSFGDEFNLLLTMRANARRGRFRELLRLKPFGSQEFVEIPVVGTVVGTINAAPSTIYFDHNGQGVHPASFLIWRPNGCTLGGLVTIDAPNGFVVHEVTEGIHPRLRKFDVRCDRADPTLTGGRIVLVFDNGNQRVSGEVQVVSLSANPVVSRKDDLEGPNLESQE